MEEGRPREFPTIIAQLAGFTRSEFPRVAGVKIFPTILRTASFESLSHPIHSASFFDPSGNSTRISLGLPEKFLVDRRCPSLSMRTPVDTKSLLRSSRVVYLTLTTEGFTFSKMSFISLSKEVMFWEPKVHPGSKRLKATRQYFLIFIL